MIKIPAGSVSADKMMIINPDGSVTYEPNVRYQQPTIIRRTYQKPVKPKYRYMIEQEGKSYRCCQWCRQWCTRKCPICDACDRIISCPLLCFILFILFWLLLLSGVLTLFGLHPGINPARRYFGTISTLSIVNNTKYIYGLDKLCNQTGPAILCLNITTSTSIVAYATTIVLNRTNPAMDGSYLLLSICFVVYTIQRLASARP